MRSTLVRGDQVRGLLALMHEAREIGPGDAQIGHVVRGIARLVGAEFVTFLVDADFGPGRRGAVIEHAASYVDGTVQRMFDAMAQRGTRFNPGARALMGRVAGRRRGEVMTYARRELLRDAEWYEDEFVHDHQRACGLDDFVYSVRVLGPARAGAVTVTRGVRDRAFDAEDANLIALFHEEYARLVKSTPVAGGARLTAREREVRDMLLTGATEKAVAAALGISRETVHGYVKAIYAAHGVSSRAELLVRCLGGAPPSRVS